MSQNLFTQPSVVACVTQIVSSHLSNNTVPVPEIPALIASVHAALVRIDPSLASDRGTPPHLREVPAGAIFQFHDVQPLGIEPEMDQAPPAQKPAVPVEESVQHEYIVCLEDGKRLRMLKRYLRAQFGLTPEEYRAKWNLPANYPMSAPAVTAQRRQHVEKVAFGRTPRS